MNLNKIWGVSSKDKSSLCSNIADITLNNYINCNTTKRANTNVITKPKHCFV